jgi:hypothetical protein
LFLVSFSETGIKVAAIMLDPDDAINEKRLGCVYEKGGGSDTM